MHMQRFLPYLLLLASVILAIFAYVPGLTGYFIFDDTVNILENPHIRIQSLDFATLRQAAFSGDAGILSRPVSVLTFALNYYLNGSLNPYYFKLTNILIHLTNGICVFALTCLLLEAHRHHHAKELEQHAARWIALAVAAVWVLHPINLTSVLYIVQRMTSLAALFTLLGMISYVYGRLAILNSKKSGWVCILCSLALFTPLAALSKENGALLPVLLLLTEVIFFRFQANTTNAKRLLIALFGITVLLPAILLIGYTLYNPNWFMGTYRMRDFTLPERLMTEARVIWLYIRMMLIPDITLLGLHHDDITISKGLLQPATTLASIAGLAALGIFAMLSSKRHPVAAFGILFFLIGHSLESTFLPLELAHEHRNYLPVFGLLFTLTYYLLNPASDKSSLGTRRGIAVFFILFMAGITFLRASTWGDHILLKEKEVAHHPNSIRANIDMGSFYATMPALSQSEAEEFYQNSYTHYVQASTLSPTDTLGLFGLIQLNLKSGLPLEHSWIPVLAQRIEKSPFATSTGNSLMSLQKCVISKTCELPPESLETLLRAALGNSTLQGKARGQLLFAWSDFLFQFKNQVDEAALAAQQAVESNPADMDSHIALIAFLISMNKLEEAKMHIKKTKSIDINLIRTSTLADLEKAVKARQAALH